MSKYELSLPGSEHVESEDFDAVDYINKYLLPDHNQIIGIDALIEQAECDINNLSGEIIARLDDQTQRVDDGLGALRNSKLFVKEITEQIEYMHLKSEKTEEVVQTLTLDIEVLNIAKQNLTKSIISLNHLDILMNQVEVLRSLIKTHDFKEILNPLQMINGILSNFINCDEIEAVRKVKDELNTIENKISCRVLKYFQKHFEGSGKLDIQGLSNACEIANILNTNLKKEITHWFVDLQLEEYIILFEEKEFWLDELDKCFNWLTKCLKHYDEHLSLIFPESWNIPEYISRNFCRITKSSLEDIMNLRKFDISLNILMSSISKTKKFEHMLEKYFDNDKFHFKNIICSCFEKYFEIYVKHIDKSLMDLIDHFALINKPPEPPNKNDETTFIFLSCIDLFIFYRKTIEQCQLFDIPETFSQIIELFKKYLSKYVDKVLEPMLPKKATSTLSMWFSGEFNGISNISQILLNKVLKDEDFKRFSRKEIFTLCCSISTAEYCLVTIEKLIEKLNSISKKSINISFTEERDKYFKFNLKCVQYLVLDTVQGCQSSLISMTKIQWHKIKDVIDQSSYISAINRVLQISIPLVKEYLKSSEKYFMQFCSKFVTTFIEAFLESILKCHTLSCQRYGCEQLLLDIHSLKNILISLPKTACYVSKKSDFKEVTPFTKLVVKGMQRAESYVRIAMVPSITVTHFNSKVQQLLPDISITEFQRILTMKNIRKRDQQVFVDSFKVLFLN